VLLAIGLQARKRLPQLHGDRHSEGAALVALLIAFAVACAVDWMWEMTVVGVVAFVALGLLLGTGLGRAEVDRPRHPLPPRRRVVLVAVIAVLGIAQALPLLAELRLRASAAAAQRGDAAAAYGAALDARSLTPWAASPRVQLALLDEQAGRLPLAARTINEAIARNPADWRLWFLAARIGGEWGDRPARRLALERLAELDPWLQNAARATLAP
jgi:tetratricopeptide (TPR) repeat protein